MAEFCRRDRRDCRGVVIDEHLRRHVERIVRPIRASGWRKNTMREELLGHLTQKVEAAVEGGASVEEAQVAAFEQLGDPDEVRRALQASVPVVQRFMFAPLPGTHVAGWWFCVIVENRWFDKKEGESAVHYALVRTAFVSALSALALVAPAVLVLPGERMSIGLGRAALVFLAGLVAGTVATFLVHFLADVAGIRDILSPRRPSSWKRNGALCLFIGVHVLLFRALFTPLTTALRPGMSADRFWDSLIEDWRAAGGVVSVVLAVIFVTLLITLLTTRRAREQYERWGSLEFDD